MVREAILPISSRHVTGLQEDSPDQQPGSGHGDQLSSTRHQTPQVGRVLDFWEIRHETLNISQRAQQLVEASWRGSTELRYGGAWRQWLEWCNKCNIRATEPALSDVLDYLAYLYDKGAQNRTVNLHRSALSSTIEPIERFCVGQHPLVCRLLKGIFNLRPPKTKLCPTWSVKSVLETLKSWSPANSLDLKCLTFKTVMLVALASAKRPSSLTLLSLKEGFCEIGESSVRFQPVGLEKTEGPSHCAPPLVLNRFTDDPRLCPAHYVKAYIRKTEGCRSSDRLFVSLLAPHGAVATSTISRWLERIISMTGASGSGGSTRSAATSRAASRGASLAAVLTAGDWARASTFRKFYFKPNELSFESHVLQ